MKKIPTIFQREWAGDRSRVVDAAHPDCAWVFAGEGRATRKVDGTCCLVRGGRLLKRRELRRGDAAPAGFEALGTDEETGKTVGWAPVGEGPEDRWHRDAFAELAEPADGTHELLGPKVQGNAEGRSRHELVRHDALGLDALGLDALGLSDDVPRDFAGLRAWLARHDVEGLVFAHPDGRMGKIKKRDFGFKR